MRELVLRPRAERAIRELAPPSSPDRERLGRVLAGLENESVPLVVVPPDFPVTHGSTIMGRPVPGTDLVVCYMPLGQVVEVINVLRR